MYLTAPLVYGLLRSFPAYRKSVCLVGFVMLIISLAGASFANNTSQLLATQGILYALGGSLFYFPAYLYLDEWFVQRRGTAYGLFIAGGGASGVVIPFIMEWLLQRWGFRTALRTWAIITTILGAPTFFMLKPRIPDHHSRRSLHANELRFVRVPAFWMLFMGNLIQSLGYFMPTLYLPCMSQMSFRAFPL